MVEVVAVIGAGASGLVASRHLLRCGFRPFVLDAAAATTIAASSRGDNQTGPSHLHSAVGGAWNSRSGKFWGSLRPNLSRYTQCFSDFPWSRVLSPWEEEGPTSTTTSPHAAYPTRAQVHEYLERYATEHDIRPQFGCKVTRVGRNPNRPSGYQITWLEEESGREQSRAFDKVVIASGFFAQGVLPECLALNHNDDDYGSNSTVLHSSQYTDPNLFTNRTVAVVGSGFSALEICSDLCPHAVQVISVLPSVPWVMPRTVVAPLEGGGCGPLPLDLALYRRRTDAPQRHVLVMDEPASRARYDALKSLLGTRKQAASSLGVPPFDPMRPPTAVIADDYLNLVLSDRIKVVHGRLEGAARKGPDGTFCLDVRNRQGQCQELESVDSIICCTGYRSQLDFLDPEILETLEYSGSDASFAPLTLAWGAVHPDLPGLGFVGMYRGVFFGVMELQARLLAEMWSNKLGVGDGLVRDALDDSRTVRSHEPRAQFPQFDVVGCMDRLASVLGLVPPKPFGNKGMAVTPTYYQQSRTYSQTALEEIEGEIERGRLGKGISRVVLSALVGRWRLERTIRHFGPEARQESVRGTVRFSVSGPNLDAVRYREDGVFALPNGREIEVFREYEYEANRGDDLEIYFVEGGQRTYLFLGLKFQPPSDTQGYWEATSDHLCIQDLYKGTFQVYLEGISASKVVMTYRVKGPNKDYESVTVLTPAD
jgi:hypothetical protein